MPRCVRRSADGNGQCTNETSPGSVLCGSCGGNLPDERRAAAERMELAKLSTLNTMISLVEETSLHLVQIMRSGEKDSDRLRAIDRILELAGVRTGQPLVQVQVNAGLRPQEDPRDARLLAIIEKISEDRAALLRSRAVEAMAHDVSA